MILHHTPPVLPHTGGRRWRIREGGNTDFWLVGWDVERATRRALIGWGLVASTIPAPRICWDHRRRHPPNISSDSRRSALGWLPNHVRMQDTQVVSCFFAFHFLASTKKKKSRSLFEPQHRESSIAKEIGAMEQEGLWIVHAKKHKKKFNSCRSYEAN